jgi:hypothetical protein
MKDLWPFGVALRGEASNHLMLRWLKTVVVSDEEKAHKMRQVGTRKASESEPLSKCRNQIRWHRNWGAWGCFRTSLAGARLLARRCPAWRRREPGLRLLRGTWEGGRRYCAPVPGRGRARGSALSGGNRKALSTVFTGFQPAVSPEALKKMSQQVRRWRIHTRTRHDLNELAALINPVVAG